MPLLDADRSIFAWEWLRRDTVYRAAAMRALERRAPDRPPECWGLHAYEHPDKSVPEARPIWTNEAYAGVLEADSLGEGPPGDLIEPDRLATFLTRTRRHERERLLLSDGLRAIRLDLLSGSLVKRPSLLRYRLQGLASAEGQLLALRRLLSLVRTGRFSAGLHPREMRAPRWILMLRASDALAEGAGQREIAARLLDPSAGQLGWRDEMPSLRSRAQRLVRAARRMKEGGYGALLAR